MTTIRTTTLDTPAGPIRLAVRGDGADEALVTLAFADHFDRVAAPVRARFAHDDWIDDGWIDQGGPGRAESVTVAAVRRYVAGELGALDGVVIDVAGTAFRQRVWDALRSIPAGQTWSYAELAAAVGSPRAVRAVGSANGANPVWLVVPCHRVVRADGTLGGYGGGVERKAWLLDHEGAARGRSHDPAGAAKDRTGEVTHPTRLGGDAQVRHP